MRVIITGGTGLIGQALTDSLVQDGYEVIVLSRRPQPAEARPGVQHLLWDGRTAAGWGHLAEGAEAIVNLAGESIAGTGFPPARWTAERKQRILNSRLQAGAAVVAAVQQAKQKPGVLLQASAVGYYGAAGDELLPGTAVPGHDFLAAVCQRWEASTAVVEEWGVRRVVLRTGVVFSQQGGVLPLLRLPFRLFVGGPMGHGHQWTAWIHMADQVRAMRFLLAHESAQGAFNLTAPQPLPNRELARVIGQVMKRPSVIPVPAVILKLALGEMATIVLDGQRAIPDGLQALGFTFHYTDVRHALQNLL